MSSCCQTHQKTLTSFIVCLVTFKVFLILLPLYVQIVWSDLYVAKSMWTLVTASSLPCCSNSLHCSGFSLDVVELAAGICSRSDTRASVRSRTLMLVIMSGSQLALRFVPKVMFFHTALGKPVLYGAVCIFTITDVVFPVLLHSQRSHAVICREENSRQTQSETSW